MTVLRAAVGTTDVGRVREYNEDTFLVDREHGIFLVADGMGGHAAGEVASALAAEAVGGALRGAVDQGLRGDALNAALDEAFRAAHQRIVQHAGTHAHTRGMGTTLTACVLHDDGTFQIGHIGDSRAYRWHGNALEQLTRDHTWVQREVDAGRLSPAAARRHHQAHVITRVLSTDTPHHPDLLAGTLAPGDLLLLATDGLTGMLSDPDLARVLGASASLKARARELVRRANRRGGRDNITLVLVEAREGKETAAPPTGERSEPVRPPVAAPER